VIAARTIATKAERWLTDAKFGLGQHWYRAELDVLDDLIKAEAISLRARTWTHQELIDRLQKQLDEEADRFAAGHI
jgi:hypothetical protein